MFYPDASSTGTDQRLMLANTGRTIWTKILQSEDFEHNLPPKFKARVSQRNLAGEDGIAIVTGHPTELSSLSKDEDIQTFDLTNCLLMDFPRGTTPKSMEEAGKAPILFSRSATHMKVTALIAHSRPLELSTFVKTAMGEIGRHLQVHPTSRAPDRRFLCSADHSARAPVASNVWSAENRL